MHPIIVIGDNTSHGGTVITCSSTCDTHGKGWARIGDKVACPKCRGIFPIVEGDSTVTDDGLPVAYHGCKVACGATLIAGQHFTFTDPKKGGAASSSTEPARSLPRGTGLIGAGLAAGYQDESLAGARERFRGRFQLIDAQTGQPLSGQATRIRSTAGQYLTGQTDVDGFTPWVERNASEALAFDIEDNES